MLRRISSSLVVVSLVAICGMVVIEPGFAQGQGKVLVPASSVERPEDVGRRMHTNHLIFMRNSGLVGQAPSGETPYSLGCVYAVSSGSTGCPKLNKPGPSGGSQTIAIVDAYDYPTAENDLNVFSSIFGLPPCTTANGCFSKVYASGSQPRANCGWGQEAALDIEWAHAMAPSAKIVLVEAASNSNANLFAAVDVATNEVICGKTTCPTGGNGEGEVSMSWGSNEFSGETSLDTHFPTGNGVVYFAASGDSGGKVIYPSASPNVVSAGGTSVNRSAGTFTSETAWSGGGGGPSQYESIPTYQSVVASIVGNQRGTPDFSFDANPNTGVSVYDSTSCQGLSGWLVFGGTSVASPSLAGIVNLSGHFAVDSGTELGTIYSNLGNGSDFRDITSGSNGYSATAGWDFATGVGSDQGTSGT